MLACLPAAFGRCDLGHLQFASSGFVPGVFALLAMPRPVRWGWGVLAGAMLVLPGLRFDTELLRHDVRMVRRHRDFAANLVPPDAVAQAPAYPGLGVPYAAHIGIAPGRYYSPLLWPAGTEVAAGVSVDTGYYAGMTNVLSPGAIANKLAEMEAHANLPVLLTDKPVEEQFGTAENNPEVLRVVEQAWYVPPVRNGALTYHALGTFLQTHYVPAEARDGLRVWRPRAGAGSR